MPGWRLFSLLATYEDDRTGESQIRVYVRCGYLRHIVLDAPEPGYLQIKPVHSIQLLALRIGNRQEQQYGQYEQAFHGAGNSGFDGLGASGNILHPEVLHYAASSATAVPPPIPWQMAATPVRSPRRRRA